MLLNAATAYMNLLRDTAILELQRSNVNVLEATLRQTRDRFTVGEVTRTDVAQAESRLAAGRSQLLAAESNYITSQATLSAGDRRRSRQARARRAGRPASRRARSRRRSPAARTEHPPITTAMYNVDAAVFQVKIAEGALYPDSVRRATCTKTFGSTTNEHGPADLVGLGGAQRSRCRSIRAAREYATIRQAKETLGQRRLDLDTARDQVQQTVTQAWGQLEAAKAQIDATHGAGRCRRDRAQRRARGSSRRPAHHARRAQRAAGSGQCARGARHRAARPRGGVLYRAGGDRRALAADPGAAASRPTIPVVHYQQVRDVWVGVRTPDGR